MSDATLDPVVNEAPAPVTEAPATPATPPAEAPAPSLRDTATEVWEKLNAARDAKGRFAGGEPKAAPDGQAATPAAPEAPAIKPVDAGPAMPASWSKDKAELWGKLDPDVRGIIAQREMEFTRGIQRYAQSAKMAEEFERLFAPHAQRLQAQGMNAVAATQRLLAAQDYLDRDPVAALQWLARSYGVRLDGAPNPSPSQPSDAAPVDPRVETLAQRLERMERELQERAAQEVAETRTAVRTEVEAFAKAHPLFDEVREHMGQLIAAGLATTMDQAYEQAVWANPVTRQKQLDAQLKAQNEKAAQEAAKAKQAGAINVRSGPAAMPAPRNMRDTISQTWDRLHAS
jgi:hypothetical protein